MADQKTVELEVKADWREDEATADQKPVELDFVKLGCPELQDDLDQIAKKEMRPPPHQAAFFIKMGINTYKQKSGGDAGQNVKQMKVIGGGE